MLALAGGSLILSAFGTAYSVIVLVTGLEIGSLSGLLYGLIAAVFGASISLVTVEEGGASVGYLLRAGDYIFASLDDLLGGGDLLVRLEGLSDCGDLDL